MIKDLTPARTIKNTRSKKNTGFFPSEKNGRPIAFESLLERDYLYLLEYDNNVLSYLEQPCTIEYFFNVKKYKYTPDFLVYRHNSTQIIEVKPQKKLDQIMNDDMKRKSLEAGKKYCISQGYEFKIVTDKDIYNGSLLKNVQKLFAYARFQIPPKEKMFIHNKLLEFGSIKIDLFIKEILLEEKDYNKYLTYIYSLLYYNNLSCDMNKPIDTSTEIWLNL